MNTSSLIRDAARYAAGLALVIGLAVALVPGCGSGDGACVATISGDPASWATCCEQDQSECENKVQFGEQPTFNASGTCSGLGFTLQCPGEGSNCYRLPAYAPCP